ncbi:MAG: dihydropteroate synthase [Rhodopirellula sp.]|nr:dihydropteroate synthase [Rhodopirellula sp.]
MSREHYLFVTGRLAEPSLRKVVESLGPAVGFDYSIQVMPITVAALMTPKWIARRIAVPPVATRVMLPGYCLGDRSVLEEAAGIPVEIGPKDLRQLPEFFGRFSERADYGEYDIEILAEINHAPRLSLHAILERAGRFQADGADVIDLGCEPGAVWAGIGDAVRALCDHGARVSVDSYNPREIAAAAEAGAELVLSVNKTNRRYADQWGCEVVVVPDAPGSLSGLEETIGLLAESGVPFRIDPILNPIGFGFGESLGRYLEVRRRFPAAEMLMGIGNLTELTDVDSAGINVLLLGFCQELRIRSVLTTEEINWARTSVRECHLARQLLHYATERQILPKHVETGLVMLRDTRLLEHGPQALAELGRAIKDHSFRIFAEEGRLHLITSGLHLEGEDPFELFEQALPRSPSPIDPSHAFYLGYEMAKAVTALALGKNYRQDEALDWGMLTQPELTRRQRRALRMARRQPSDCDDEEGRG